MSTTITAANVRQIAALARLALSEEEVTSATRDLSRVLDHFSSLQQIDTASVPESADVTGQQNVSREDVPLPEALCATEDLLKRAPDAHDQYFKVPAVF